MNALNETVLNLIARELKVESVAFKLITISQNHVYRFHWGENETILRISNNRDHGQQDILAELGWIMALSAKGLSVCVPYLLPSGNLCDFVTFEGSKYYYVCFSHASGRPIDASDVDQPLYRLMGRLIGEMHQAAEGYHKEGKSRLARREWHESRLLLDDMERYLPDNRDAFKKAVRSLISEIREIPVAPKDYGLIHGDVSFQNCYISGQDLTIFDFENCEYGLFTEDLAVAYYSAIFNSLTGKQRRNSIGQFANDFWSALRAGYSEVRQLPDDWILSLEPLLILREAVIYTHYHRIFDISKESESFQMGVDEMRANVESHRVGFPWKHQ